MSTADEAEAPSPRGAMLADLRRWSLANLRYAADLILPPICIRCHQPISAHGVLCAACWQGIDFITPPLCDRLGLPLPYGGEAPLLSAMALRHPPLYGRARAVARFEGVMRDLVHGFKYADRHEAVGLFARMLRSAGADLLGDADLLVPVPLHPRRLWTRRYNQAAILARQLSLATGVPADMSALRRIRRTPSQVGLSRAERRENVAAAFSVGPRAAERIRGKRLLLIEDVITTGATLGACAQVLAAAGAARVDCLALAIVVKDDQLLAE